MTLAIIAIFAALNTRFDYLFTDVRQIDVTGDKEASVGENVKGEHVARFYEWLAESKWIMQKCGANIPKSLSRWSPPVVHNIGAMQDAISAYRDTISMDSTNAVRWIRRSLGGNYECYSATYDGDRSYITVAEIANRSWEAFCSTSRYKPTDYSQYYYPFNSEIPSVISGDELSHDTINQLNDKSVSSDASDRLWYRIGANRVWSAKHVVSTTTTSGGDPYSRDLGPFWYSPAWVQKTETDYRFTHLTPTPYTRGYGIGKYTLYNIVKADIDDGVLPKIETRMDSDGPLSFYVGDNEIAERYGIGIYQKRIFLFICCWKCGYSNGNWKINTKVIAKEITDRFGNNISAAVNQVESSVADVDGTYKASFVSILFAAHGQIFWTPNATENALRD